ncbi:MAG: amino acid ABC transporter permease [Hyphomicrobiales bacterium]|nr:amino acid ABC transporter permease [Hyphomicrobiales bacterium]MCY4038498.1 amino acid ABC transporter permease [Hyphomicrobiales bacterium]
MKMQLSNSSKKILDKTDLPVMKPFSLARASTWQAGDVVAFSLSPRVAWALAFILVAWISVDVALAQVQGDPNQTVLETLIKWTPLMFFGAPGEFGGFVLNIAVSFIAMALGTFLGLWLGIGQIALSKFVRRSSWLVTQIFRNSPWLVLLFYFMLLLPFFVEIGGTRYDIPGWAKATFALSLPIMANMSEIVRGAIASIPTGQWESAESLAFTRIQTLWQIILPQCIKRMIPPWMNWYCILTMSTPLISILGVNDGMTLTQDALAAESRSEFLIPMYLWLMSWFFIYSYPIAQWTRRLERRFAVKN